MTFTDVRAPTFAVKFWEIRQMIKEWNTHMANVFLAGWVICLDDLFGISGGRVRDGSFAPASRTLSVMNIILLAVRCLTSCF